MAANLIIGAALKAIGGGMEGAAKPFQNVDASKMANGFETFGEGLGSKIKNKEEKKRDDEDRSFLKRFSKVKDNETFTDEAKAQASRGMDLQKASGAFKDDSAKGLTFGNQTAFNKIGSALGGNFPSDEELKNIYGDSLSDSILENFAKINAIDFTYKDEAKEKYGENPNVDDAEHIGVKAQELEANPATKGTVATNENGDKMLNTDHLTAVNTAAISELSRRVLALEEVIKSMNKGA